MKFAHVRLSLVEVQEALEGQNAEYVRIYFREKIGRDPTPMETVLFYVENKYGNRTPPQQGNLFEQS